MDEGQDMGCDLCEKKKREEAKNKHTYRIQSLKGSIQVIQAGTEVELVDVVGSSRFCTSLVVRILILGRTPYYGALRSHIAQFLGVTQSLQRLAPNSTIRWQAQCWDPKLSKKLGFSADEV